MSSNTQTSLPMVACALILSLVLILVPLPHWAAMARPLFYPAAIVFWALHQPRRFGIFTAWLCGLPLDVITNALLGQHGLALGLAAFATIKLRDLLLALPIWQQSIVLLPVFALYEFTLFWIDGINGRMIPPLWRWLPVLSTAVIWPIWHIILERFADAEVNNDAP